MTKPASENHGRAQKVPSTEYPTDATVPEHVPGVDESGRPSDARRGRTARREEPRNHQDQGPTPQPPLGGERADNGSD
jgi:hypothetical protein